MVSDSIFSEIQKLHIGKGKFFYQCSVFLFVFINVGPRNSNHRPEKSCIMLRVIPVQEDSDSVRLKARSHQVRVQHIFKFLALDSVVASVSYSIQEEVCWF